MPFTTAYLADVQTVSITYEGVMGRADGEASITAIGDRVAEHGSHRFLADCSRMQVTGSLFDVMAFVERLSSLRQDAGYEPPACHPQRGVFTPREQCS